ncbi:MAG: CPBP family intramembrane glutamic endopeptidase [Gaiellaceae bacterium]
MSRARLLAWIALVTTLATVSYALRYAVQGGSRSTPDAVYSFATFAGGMIQYVIWLTFVLAIASGRYDLLALHRPSVSWRRVAVLAAVVIAAIYLCEALVSLLPLPQSPGHEQGLAPTRWEPRHEAAFTANLLLFAVVAPAVEELTFRGLGQSLLSFLGRWPSLVLVGVAFGLAHGLLEALLVLIPFGIGLAWLRDRTRSVVPGMVVHGLFNALALIVAVATASS